MGDEPRTTERPLLLDARTTTDQPSPLFSEYAQTGGRIPSESVAVIQSLRVCQVLPQVFLAPQEGEPQGRAAVAPQEGEPQVRATVVAQEVAGGQDHTVASDNQPRQRVQAPEGDRRAGQPQIHAAELQGARETRVEQTADGRLIRHYSNGFTITQYTQGERAGAEVLTDSLHRPIRQLESNHSNARRQRLEMEYSYQGNSRDASGLVIREAQSGTVIARTSNQANAEGLESPRIQPTPTGFRLELGDRVETFDVGGLHFAESPNRRESQITIHEDTRTPEGFLYPRGSVVEHYTRGGTTYTSLHLPDNDTTQMFERTGDNQARCIGERYARPRTVPYQVNGSMMNFDNVFMQIVQPNGDLQLFQTDGSITTLVHRNGLYIDARKEHNARVSVASAPPGLRHILLNGQDLRTPTNRVEGVIRQAGR